MMHPLQFIARLPQPSEATLMDGTPAPSSLTLTYHTFGNIIRYQLHNGGIHSVRVQSVCLASEPAASPSTLLYGEGFQMLSQTGGTVGAPLALGNYTDAQHYRLPEPPDTTTVYGMLLTSDPVNGKRSLRAFTSCRRFSGKFRLSAERIEAIVDTEGLELAPGATWELEDLMIASGDDPAELLANLGSEIGRNHPPLPFRATPAGWCSWYCFGPDVTEQQVRDNLDMIAQAPLALLYVQIDDGYQSAMGDWLETSTTFGGGVQGVLEEIRKRGFKPAIWVAPFIAESGSRVFQEHPDWFVKDAEGKPLPSDRVTFGGWRRGPWYALDGTHPGAQRHLEHVFRTMQEEWGCTYFKLDANFWGAMHSGHRYDPNATRIEAYRRGMEAILRGAGPDSFLLGCNHPIWPSFGLIHGSRSSNDISRDWHTFAQTARENLSRNWQNGWLWTNDPDCLLLTGDLTDDEFLFHATALYATGGMLLSGDDMTRLSPERLQVLKKLLPPNDVAAQFEDETLRIGWIDQVDQKALCLFNWQEVPQTLSVRLPHPARLHNFWTDTDLGAHQTAFETGPMPPHSARLILCRPL